MWRMSTEKTGLPIESLIQLGRRQASLAERLGLAPYLKRSEDILGIYNIDPMERVWVEGSSYRPDPLWGAIESRALERARTSAELVTQGTLAYVHADAVPYRVERYIPIDIYLEETDVAALIELDGAVRDLFETLGFEYITYPAVAISSTHGRGALKTSPMTPSELKKTESGIAKGLRHLNGNNKGGDSAKDDVGALLEVAKLQAELNLANQEIERSKAETKKANAEREAAVMDKRDKIASLLLKGVGVVALTIGTWVATGSGQTGNAPVDPPAKVGRAINSQKTDKASHLKQFGEFLKKLAEQGKGGE